MKTKKEKKGAVSLEERRFALEKAQADRLYALQKKADERAEREYKLHEEELELKRRAEEQANKETQHTARNDMARIALSLATLAVAEPVLGLIKQFMVFLVDFIARIF